VRLVFPDAFDQSNCDHEQLLDNFYDDVRNGLYHAGITKPSVMVSWEFPHPIVYNIASKCLQINPIHLIATIKAHFDNYVEQLLNQAKVTERQNFEKRFDYEATS
jgi:hypothetical protein